MNPYLALGEAHFWGQSVAKKTPEKINYDPAPKFRFRLDEDRFATCGSCFAQHFGRELVVRGGNLLFTETKHPLMESEQESGYTAFPARYGNIYSTRQLLELLQQAFAFRRIIFEFAQRADGRWVDMLRPRAIPPGFSSAEEARADRIFHLECVRRLICKSTVFVFTMGLTETWVNKRRGYCYGICPGVAGGAFNPDEHEFVNASYAECLEPLSEAVEIVHKFNPGAKVLLTVSPVMLVATMESRGALQSSIASKSILRAVADELTRTYAFVDYFPAFEIIVGPQAKGRYYVDGSLREVSEEGVRLVMDAFFSSRTTASSWAHATRKSIEAETWVSEMERLRTAECDEILYSSPARIDG